MKLIQGKGISGSMIKYIAIFAMFIDHIAWAFVSTYSVQGQIMHIIGRITAPIMCYFIAEGYFYTRNVNRYALRLFTFAVISYFPFIYEVTGRMVPILYFNMIFTLFVGLMAIIIYDKIENKFFRTFLIFICCAITIYSDWMIFGVLYCVNFWKHRGDFKKQCIAFSITSIFMFLTFGFLTGMTESLFQFGVLLALPILAQYNGKRGSSQYGKWVFYFFYPVHLFIIALIKYGF
ncbi:TraX family protein [Clostridium cellulovorans]|uniref:Fimbrial assembly protein FimC, putative n=1 Tax=Clostridium cellulovorans (strain ATCC 35296 / DSM 3052 / OCM 3 / 743B) TaxID=573061 RepID=D9SQI8_CLOC7|nr:TraX family protein [Clostridium cellulovorans]ADL52194.1 fimbrial assembly protein FimC, putative [Clostridium cellulovorans 743B]